MTGKVGAIVIGGHVNGTGVIRALGRNGIIVDLVSTLPSDIAHRSRFVRHHHRLLELPDRPEALIELLDRHADEWRGWAILPTNDHALAVLAKHHEALSPRFRLTVPRWDIAERILDKQLTNQLAREVGIKVPRTMGPAVRSCLDGAAELSFPVLVKPRQGHIFSHVFNRKLFMAGNARELADAIGLVERAGIDCEIVQFVKGPDSCIRHFQVYVDASGDPHGEFTFRKLRQEPPLFGVARAAEPVDAPELREPSLELLRRIGWHGIASVAYKTDAVGGEVYLMEVNGRCPLSHGLALRAGINYPLMAYSEATFGRIAGVRANGWQGVWINLHADFFTTIKYFREEHLDWRLFLDTYLRPKTFADWAADDPGPFFTQWWLSLKKTPRRVREGLRWLLNSVIKRLNFHRIRELLPP